jgi:hypothetical protein
VKKYYKISIFLFLALFLWAGSAMALPFSSTGIVDRNYNDSWNPDTLTGTALFEFYIDEPGFSANRVTLEFENDIFDVSSINESSFNVLNPAGWTTDLHTSSTTGYGFSISTGGTPATMENDPIKITFDYVLLSADRYYEASDGTNDGWAWDEGQPWAVSYTLEDVVNINGKWYSGDASSGSTGAPVPEPATMMMLGTGLIGMAVFGRKKFLKS